MTDPNGAPPARRPTFDATFNLGHVLTVVVIILSVAGSVLALRDGLQSAVGEVRAENKLQDQRIDATAKDLVRSQAEDTTFRSEIRQSLTQLSTAVQDLRVKIVEATAAAAQGNNSNNPSRR